MHEHNTYACFRVNYPFADICSVTRWGIGGSVELLLQV